MKQTPALAVEAIGIGKRFGAVQALDGVSLKVGTGEFHALLGENGAGKSTLVKCLVGFHPPDTGSFLVDGREHAIDSPREAQRLAIGMVYQHFTLAPGMTVAENLLLARGDLPARIRWRREIENLRSFMAAMPFQLSLNARVSDLAAGEKQKLEILKQLYLKQRLLILDEPTSVLTPGEADVVLGLLHGMTRKGELTVIMITHKFREVLAYCDCVSILRRGRHVGGGKVAELGADAMAAMMMGDEGGGEALHEAMAAGTKAERAAAPAEAPPYLDVTALEVDNDRGLPAVNKLTLTVRPGELVGIAGVAGNGQKELVETLLGQRAARAGTVAVAGTPYRGSRGEIRRHQVFSLPEEPLRNACVPGMSVAENMALRGFDAAPLRRGWRLQRRALRARARELITEFNVRPPAPDTAIDNLSGGNVQRAVLARELSEPVRLLIVANPVFGLDFAATAGIHKRLLAARDAGAAVLLVSEDLDEIIELSDRILVMSEGRIVFETTSASPAEIGRHMAGHSHPRS